MRGQEISLQKWLKRYWIGMGLFLVAIYFLVHAYMQMLFTKRAEDSIQKSIHIAANGIEDSLQIVDSFIYEALYSGTTQSTSQLYHALKEEKDLVTLMETRNQVVSSLQSITSWSDMIDFILLYTERDDELVWLESGTDQSFYHRKEVKKFISGKIEQGEIENLGRYVVCDGESERYMLRLMKIEGSYLVVGVSQHEILSLLRQSAFSDDSIAFAADSDGKIIFSTAPVAELIRAEDEGTYVTIDGNEYLQTDYRSDKSGYYFGMLTRRESILADIWLFHILFAIVFLIALFLLPASFYLIYRYVERPVESLSKTMKQIAEGDLEHMVEKQTQIKELAALVSAFNNMVSKIRQLKIEKYEVKLEAQKATMQYLQLQIKPHFYANLLNIIYSLAERKDFETIQKVSKAMVNYSRYMFRDASELVELRQEIEHVRYYMEIQEIRYMMQISCSINIAEELESALIPPFIIQSFVENSVKYAFSTKKNCGIDIVVTIDEGRKNVHITVRDNGDGYREELLKLDWDEKNEEGHIGLTNIYKRLRIIYGENASVLLHNDSGAVSEVTIPYIAVDNMEFDD